MLSGYFKIKTETKEFENNLSSIIDSCRNKKVLLYGKIEELKFLNKKYNLSKTMNIVRIADENLNTNTTKNYQGIKLISLKNIQETDFDTVVILSDLPQQIVSTLEVDYKIDKNNIYPLFIELIKEERQSINFLYKNKFNKTFPRLVKKLKNKKVVLYGAGIFLETINKYFDLTQLNIIGIADKKYSIVNNKEAFLGYKTYHPSEILDLKPDYVLISTKFYVSIFEFLHFDLLPGSNIKIKPLVQKNFVTLLKEIIES